MAAAGLSMADLLLAGRWVSEETPKSRRCCIAQHHPAWLQGRTKSTPKWLDGWLEREVGP